MPKFVTSATQPFVQSSTGQIRATAGKSLSYWKDLAERNPPEKKQSPEPIVKRLTEEERSAFIIGIKNKAIEVTEELLTQIGKFAFEDAMMLLGRIRWDIEEIAIKKQALKIQRDLVEQHGTPDIASIHEDIVKHNFSIGDEEFLEKLNGFTDEQKTFLIKVAMKHGFFRKLQGSIEKNFYSSDYGLCRESFNLVMKFPNSFWPDLVSRVFTSSGLYYRIFLDAVKLVSQLDDEGEKERLFGLALEKIKDLIIHKNYGTGNQRVLADFLPLFPEAMRIQLFEEMLHNDDIYFSVCALKHLSSLPADYKTEKFWEEYANKFKASFNRYDYGHDWLGLLLADPFPLPSEYQFSFLCMGAESGSSERLFFIIKKISKLQEGEEKQELWGIIADNKEFQEEFSRLELRVDSLSLLAMFPEEHKTKLLLRVLRNQYKIGLDVPKKIIELMNSIVEDVSLVVMSALKSRDSSIANAALNLRERIPSEQEEAFVNRAILAHHEEVCMAGLELAINSPKESKLKLLASAMEAHFPNVRKKALEHALSLNTASQKKLRGILNSQQPETSGQP